jgi:AcrR family transcriptional regulator
VAAAPSTRRGAARHSELFDALVDLLLAEGFAHLTLDDVAARLRCSKRTLYALAGSKEQLVRAAVVHFFERATDRVEAAVAACTDPEQRLAAYLRAVADELATIPEVDYVVICAGGYDLLVELVCTDDEHLLTLLNEAIRAVPGVTGTETFMYLKLAKQTYQWGTR